ncbi:hypothetical protein PuT2_15685 [Pusillimonas sp. T2]|nr:hypothetical protein PuT2_15685 [Pusillimonas sp. T2]
MYAFFHALACPDGWLMADGLNGTLDLRGEFIRGWDAGRGVDSGRPLGAWQADELKRHAHQANTGRLAGNGFASGGNLLPRELNLMSATSETGGDETRPRNVALLACAKQ